MDKRKTAKTKQQQAWPGGIGIIEPSDTVATTSGTGMALRHRAAPLDAAPPSVEDLIRPAEAWAHRVLECAGIAASGLTNGTDDTRENYAQRFIHYGKSIRDKIKRGDAAGAAADALLLGGFIRESQLLHRWESHVDGYAGIKALASEKGTLGAEVRWGGDDREALNGILLRLAKMRDELGDDLRPSELWPELWNALSEAGAKPKENKHRTLLDATITYGNGRIEYTFTAFRKAIKRLHNGGT